MVAAPVVAIADNLPRTVTYLIFMHLPRTCGLGLTVTTGLFADAPMVGCLFGGVPVGLYIPALITLTRPVALGCSRTPVDTVDPVVQS